MYVAIAHAQGLLLLPMQLLLQPLPLGQESHNFPSVVQMAKAATTIA